MDRWANCVQGLSRDGVWKLILPETRASLCFTTAAVLRPYMYMYNEYIYICIQMCTFRMNHRCPPGSKAPVVNASSVVVAVARYLSEQSAFVFVFCYIFFFYNFIAESQIHINLYNTELMRRNLQYLQRCLPIFLVHSVRLNPNFIIILCEAEYCHSIKKPFFFGFFIQ